jgi:hypothetical protein
MFTEDQAAEIGRKIYRGLVALGVWLTAVIAAFGAWIGGLFG